MRGSLLPAAAVQCAGNPYMAIWISYTGQSWVLGAGCWVLGVGCWVLGAGCWVLGAGCWVMMGVHYSELSTQYSVLMTFLRSLYYNL
jgi:hypothetical protein